MMVTLTEHCRCGASFTATMQHDAVDIALTAERLQREWRERHARLCPAMSEAGNDATDAREAAVERR